MTHQPTASEVTADHRIILVTGPSGAGRSTAIRALEDQGFETIDNLPLSLLPSLFGSTNLHRSIALGLDVRNRDFSVERVIQSIEWLAGHNLAAHDLLYLDSRTEVLVRRYSETRRRHPMAPGETAAIGIERELNILAPLRTRADILIDTSDLTPHDLRAEVTRWFASGHTQDLAVSVNSFSYKRGVPHGVDMVFDSRFLRNPHWSRDLRPKDGREQDVVSYVTEDARFSEFYGRVKALAEFLLPAYVEEGKTHLAFAFGCTGGQHRSVVLAEKLAQDLSAHGWTVSVRHHELERQGRADTPLKAGDAA